MSIYIIVDDFRNPSDCSWWNLTPGQCHDRHYCSYGELASKDFSGCRWLTVAELSTGNVWQYDAKENLRTVYDAKTYNDKGEPGEWKTTEKTKLRYFLKEGQTPEEAVSEALQKLEEKCKQGNTGTASKPKIKENVTVEFKDKKQVKDFFDRSILHKKWEENITDEQIKSVNDYTDKDIASFINTELRKEKSEERNLDAENINRINLIDEAINSYELETDITVYRAIPLRYFKSERRPYWDAAYFSSSCYKKADILKNILESVGKACLFIVEVPAGKGRGAYINRFSREKDKEYEFLIKRLARFEVINISDKDYGKEVRLRMICED